MLFVSVLFVTMVVLFFERLLITCLKNKYSISCLNYRKLAQRFMHYLTRFKIQYQSIQLYNLLRIYINLLRGLQWFNGSCLPLHRVNKVSIIQYLLKIPKK